MNLFTAIALKAVVLEVELLQIIAHTASVHVPCFIKERMRSKQEKQYFPLKWQMYLPLEDYIL